MTIRDAGRREKISRGAGDAERFAMVDAPGHTRHDPAQLILAIHPANEWPDLCTRQEQIGMGDQQHTTWEYRTASDLTADALNDLGKDGWELVAVENRIFYLKRPRLSFREMVTLDQQRRYYALWNVASGDEEASR